MKDASRHLSVQERREESILALVENIIRDHVESGFSYPLKSIDSIQMRMPVGVVFQNKPSSIGSFLPPVEYDGKRIIVRTYDMYEFPTNIDTAIDSIRGSSLPISKNADFFENIYRQTRHVFRTPKNRELRDMLSEALGEYLVERLIKDSPESWLAKSTLGGSIILGGMKRSFFHFYEKPAEEVSDCVWKRFADDRDARASFWSGSAFRENAGCALVWPLFKGFRQKGIERLIQNVPESDPDAVESLPSYVDDLHRKLSDGAY